MNSKIKILTTLMLISGVILLMGAGCVKKGPVSPATTPKEEEATVPQLKPETEESEKGISKMTDDIYIEIVAQAAYHYGRGDSTDWASHGEKDLLAKYGVTGENIIAYAEALKEDPSHAQAIAPKFQQRLQELQKTGK